MVKINCRPCYRRLEAGELIGKKMENNKVDFIFFFALSEPYIDLVLRFRQKDVHKLNHILSLLRNSHAQLTCPDSHS